MGNYSFALSPPLSVRHRFCHSPIWQVPEGRICQCRSPDKGSSITYICSFFPYALCIATTVILRFFDLRRFERKHVQLVLIKMHILAAGGAAFTAETRPGDLMFARHSVTCKFTLNAVIFGGKQYENFLRKYCLHRKAWCTFPSSLPPFPPHFNSSDEI